MTWTTPEQVRATLTRRWQSGQYLTAYGRAEAFEPLPFPIRKPSAREISEQFEQVRAWSTSWAQSGFRVETVPVGGRSFGTNELPNRAWVDDLPQLAKIAGADAQLHQFATMLAETDGQFVGWLIDHPIKALTHASIWTRLLASAQWIQHNSGKGLYLRHVDAYGVDTKFIEQHRAVIANLLGSAVPELTSGFLTKPKYVRLRGAFGGFTEITVRTDEFDFKPNRVFIVENEISYLAFPEFPDGAIIFGGGYGVSTVAGLSPLQDAEVFYWSDIDTHGFQMLSRLRAVVPHTHSLLMDRQTLLHHELHWGQEPSPVNVALAGLTDPEQVLYRDLVEDTFGTRIRLEQERIRFSSVEEAVGRVSR